MIVVVVSDGVGGAVTDSSGGITGIKPVSETEEEEVSIGASLGIVSLFGPFVMMELELVIDVDDEDDARDTELLGRLTNFPFVFSVWRLLVFGISTELDLVLEGGLDLLEGEEARLTVIAVSSKLNALLGDIHGIKALTMDEIKLFFSFLRGLPLLVE